MESQNIEFRAVIKFLTKEGAKAKEIHRRMADVYGDSSPKYSTVAKWSAEFKRGRDSLEDDPRPGHPADVISQEMIERVERLVLNNRRIKAAELPSECAISNGSVYTIIHEHLAVIFLPAHPESRTHTFCFGTHILNLSESQDSQSYSEKFCNGRNDFLVGLTLYSPSESWDA